MVFVAAASVEQKYFFTKICMYVQKLVAILYYHTICFEIILYSKNDKPSSSGTVLKVLLHAYRLSYVCYDTYLTILTLPYTQSGMVCMPSFVDAWCCCCAVDEAADDVGEGGRDDSIHSLFARLTYVPHLQHLTHWHTTSRYDVMWKEVVHERHFNYVPYPTAAGAQSSQVRSGQVQSSQARRHAQHSCIFWHKWKLSIGLDDWLIHYSFCCCGILAPGAVPRRLTRNNKPHDQEQGMIMNWF